MKKIIQRITNSGKHMADLLNLDGVQAVNKRGLFAMDCRKLARGERYALKCYGQIGDTIVEYENHEWGVIPKEHYLDNNTPFCLKKY